MNSNGDNTILLDGWEGIAIFLHCSEKFAQELAQEGMPVYKLKGKIYGIPEDILDYTRKHPIPKKRLREEMLV